MPFERVAVLGLAVGPRAEEDPLLDRIGRCLRVGTVFADEHEEDVVARSEIGGRLADDS